MQASNITKSPISASATLLPLTLLFSTAVIAAELETQPSTGAASAADESPEEIRITGRRTLLTFRIEMEQAEDHMYELFNTYNSSDKLDLTCEQRTRWFSHMKYRSCNRRYMEDAEQKATQEAMDLGFPAKDDSLLWAENAANHQQFNAELKAAAERHPEMLAAIIDVVEKRKRYEEERRERALKGRLGFLAGKED